jgi:hypothetical protein
MTNLNVLSSMAALGSCVPSFLGLEHHIAALSLSRDATQASRPMHSTSLLQEEPKTTAKAARSSSALSESEETQYPRAAQASERVRAVADSQALDQLQLEPVRWTQYRNTSCSVTSTHTAKTSQLGLTCARQAPSSQLRSE